MRELDAGAVVGMTVTVSGGFVSVRPGESFEACAARADALLYKAEDEGRDRLLLAEAE